MDIGTVIRIVSLPVIIILFVAARKSELNKKYKRSFALYILMALLCLALFFSGWLKNS
jgi:O-antigen/teichoic acid export membrane protein